MGLRQILPVQKIGRFSQWRAARAFAKQPRIEAVQVNRPLPMRARWWRGPIQTFLVAVELLVVTRILKHVPKQAVSGDRDRQWMSDDYFDLIVWYKTDGAIHVFQLCYGKPASERALMGVWSSAM